MNTHEFINIKRISNDNIFEDIKDGFIKGLYRVVLKNDIDKAWIYKSPTNNDSFLAMAYLKLSTVFYPFSEHNFNHVAIGFITYINTIKYEVDYIDYEGIFVQDSGYKEICINIPMYVNQLVSVQYINVNMEV